MSNLPDDWSSYYSTCAQCGHRYHASGASDCACVQCRSCGRLTPPHEVEDGRLCMSCHDATDEHERHHQAPDTIVTR